jgi:hypothetical protein
MTNIILKCFQFSTLSTFDIMLNDYDSNIDSLISSVDSLTAASGQSLLHMYSLYNHAIIYNTEIDRSSSSIDIYLTIVKQNVLDHFNEW